MLSLGQLLTGGLHAFVRSRPQEVHEDCAFPGCTAAHIGTSVLQLVDGLFLESEVWFWLHSAEGAIPVTSDGPWAGLQPDRGNIAVEFPGKHVLAPGDGQWCSRAEWLRAGCNG